MLEPDDSALIEPKIEIDVAEETPACWLTGNCYQGESVWVFVMLFGLLSSQYVLIVNSDCEVGVGGGGRKQWGRPGINVYNKMSIPFLF